MKRQTDKTMLPEQGGSSASHSVAGTNDAGSPGPASGSPVTERRKEHLRAFEGDRRKSPEAGRDAERFKAALGLVWSLHVRQHVHLGHERWSGFEQGCIACICALVLGETSDPSPTTEELLERRRVLKEAKP